MLLIPMEPRTVEDARAYRERRDGFRALIARLTADLRRGLPEYVPSEDYSPVRLPGI